VAIGSRTGWRAADPPLPGQERRDCGVFYASADVMAGYRRFFIMRKVVLARKNLASRGTIAVFHDGKILTAS